jgi:hypothetical protein
MFCDSIWREDLAVILFLVLATFQFVSGCATVDIAWTRGVKKAGNFDAKV